MESPKISILIANYNNGHFFKDCFNSLIIQTENNWEAIVIDDCSRIATPNKLKFPKNLYLKKLKSYKIDFRSDWKNSEHKNFPGHKGYGNENVWFIVHDLLNIFQFPNFEKFKSLEKLSLYNFFRESEKEGSLFDHELNNEEDLLKINTLCKKSNIKDIWIYGYNFRKANELVGTKFPKLALGLSANLNIKINGLNNNTLQKIQVAPFSLSSIFLIGYLVTKLPLESRPFIKILAKSISHFSFLILPA